MTGLKGSWPIDCFSKSSRGEIGFLLQQITMANTINSKIASMSYGALEAKKTEIVQRLTEISLPAPQRRSKPLQRASPRC
jgi:hypothetical protein